jgi:hypothetical protein
VHGAALDIKDIDHIMKSEHEFALLRLHRTMAVHCYISLVLSYDDGECVSCAPTSDLTLVNRIDIDEFMLYLRTPHVIN